MERYDIEGWLGDKIRKVFSIACINVPWSLRVISSM